MRRGAVAALAAAAAVVLALLAVRREAQRAERFHFDEARQALRADGWRGLLPAPLAPRVVLLTLDDGPSDAAADARLLEVLRRHHAHAIWFVTCANLDPATSPRWQANRATLRRIVAEGHVLGNHGYHHRPLPEVTREGPAALRSEISACSDLITAVAGVRPRYFRPPWGVDTPASAQLVADVGMQVMLWDINSYDSLSTRFRRRPAEFRARLRDDPVFAMWTHAQPGSVVLMHDAPHTALAADEILSRFEAAGFRFAVPAPLAR